MNRSLQLILNYIDEDCVVITNLQFTNNIAELTV